MSHMSTLHPSHESLHVPIPVAAIAPHLLHSPTNSPQIEPNNFVDSFRDPDPDSPQSLGYPPSPLPDSSSFAPPEPSSPTTTSQMTSPNGMLVVYSYYPVCGPPGTQMTAQVDFTNLSGTNVRLRIVFGDLALPTSVTPTVPLAERPRGQERGDWTLKISIPPAGQAAAHTVNIGMVDGRLQWPLTLQALDSAGRLLDSVTFGLFSYENYSVPSQSSSPSSMYDYRNRPSSPPNRMREGDNDHPPSMLNKRASIDSDPLSLRPMSITPDSQAYIGSQVSSGQRTYFQPSTSASISNTGLSVSPQVFHQQVASTERFQNQTHSPRRSNLYPDPSTAGLLDDIPALIRTSQLAQDAKSEQANIALHDDLESIKRSWSEAEQKAGRRLVQFWKRQAGTTLQISFGVIPQSAYKENTIVVSCIYREDVDDYFITSVDIIYLLEALAGSRFEVEEKNRIRRNLEGFKPLTISKGKLGTEEFFRVIMEFPPPRPRNIEKDVKVFEWSKLKMMLEKVFSKYSTVSPLQLSQTKHETPEHASRSMYSYPKVPSRYLVGAGSAYIGDIVRPKVEEQSTTIPPAPSRIPLTNQNPQVALPDGFLSHKFGGYNDYFQSNNYYNGMRLYEMPVDFEQSNKINSHSTVSGDSLPYGAGNFRSDSPASSDNSPLSMTLSISSGGNSDGQGAVFHGNNPSSLTTL